MWRTTLHCTSQRQPLRRTGKRQRVVWWSAIGWLALFAVACDQDSRARRSFFGEVELREIDVASRISARIQKVFAKPGTLVAKGDPLVQFDDDILQARRARAEATIAAAQSQADIADNAVRPEEKEQLRASVAALKKQMEFAKASLRRTRDLFKDGAISRQTLEEVELKSFAATEKYRAARAKQAMANKGAREEQRRGANAMVDKAKTALAEIEAYQKDLLLRAPIDGEVFQVIANEGELVPQGYAVVTLLDTKDPWVTFQVSETNLSKFPMGQKVRLKVVALPGRVLNGSIHFVSPMGSFATKVFTQDKASFDLKTFELHAGLESMPAMIRPGMTVEVMPSSG